MRVAVIEAPEPIVAPEDIPGAHSPDDPLVLAMIQAATEEIDGPSGWVGRCFGPQTLELTGACWPDFVHLPYPPFIELAAVSWVDAAGVAQSWAPGGAAFPVWQPPAVRGRLGDVIVRYRAGYEEGKTGKVPERARQAVVLMATTMLSAMERGGGLRSFEATGAFTKQFNSPEMMERVRSTAVERLLQTLRVYA